MSSLHMNETFKSLTRKDAETALATALYRLLPTAPTNQREVSTLESRCYSVEFIRCDGVSCFRRCLRESLSCSREYFSDFCLKRRRLSGRRSSLPLKRWWVSTVPARRWLYTRLPTPHHFLSVDRTVQTAGQCQGRPYGDTVQPSSCRETERRPRHLHGLQRSQIPDLCSKWSHLPRPTRAANRGGLPPPPLMPGGSCIFQLSPEGSCVFQLSCQEAVVYFSSHTRGQLCISALTRG